MNKEELINIKGGISFGIMNVLSKIGDFILTSIKKTIFPIKFRI